MKKKPSTEKPAANPPSFASKLVKVADLVPHPKNYRTHPDDQLEHIVASIKQHGLYRNVVLGRGKVILAGHGVVAACKRMGMDLVPAIELDLDPSSPLALKILTGDNEISRLGTVTEETLAEILRLASEDNLVGTGYDSMMLSALEAVIRPASEINPIDETEHWQGMPHYEPTAPRITLTVMFHSEADRQAFADLLKQRVTKDTVVLWWPAKERDDVSSVRFKS